jgi:hypothetical protein
LRSITKPCVLNNDNYGSIFLVKSCPPPFRHMTVKVTNSLKTTFNLRYVQERSSIFTDSTLRTPYKDKSVHVSRTNNRCLL